MAMVDEDASAQKLLEKELQELDKQRLEVEHRIKELEAKERFEIGRSGGHGRDREKGDRGERGERGDRNNIERGIKRSRDDVGHEGRGRPEFRGRGRPDFRQDGPHGRQDFRQDFRQDGPHGRQDFRPDFLNKRRYMDEDKAPKITSTVVKVSNNDPQKPQPSLNNTEDDKKRHRKMFGLLIGTLQQFKKEGEAKADVEVKRHEIEQKVETKVEQERAELIAQHQKILNEAKDKELKLKEEILKKQEETELAILAQKWAKHHALLGLFIKTKTKPSVYYTFGPKAPPIEVPKGDEKEGESEEPKKSKRGHDDSSETSSDSEDERGSDAEKEPKESEKKDGGDSDKESMKD